MTYTKEVFISDVLTFESHFKSRIKRLEINRLKYK
jgi:hypothetical protein